MLSFSLVQDLPLLPYLHGSQLTAVLTRKIFRLQQVRTFCTTLKMIRGWATILFVALRPILASGQGELTGTPAYVDKSFSCPLVTSCPAICVSDITSCPQAATCPQDRPLLCDDGSCVTFTDGCDASLYSPCAENVCGNAIACAIPVMEWEACPIVFEDAYAEAENCEAADWVPSKVSWTDPAFIVGYCWICIVTAMIIGFCAYNQRFAPVGKILPLDEFVKARTRRKSSYPALEDMTKSIQQGSDESLYAWTQTAYKRTLVGTSIYALTICTWWAFHCVLAVRPRRAPRPAYTKSPWPCAKSLQPTQLTALQLCETMSSLISSFSVSLTSRIVCGRRPRMLSVNLKWAMFAPSWLPATASSPEFVLPRRVELFHPKLKVRCSILYVFS